MEKQFEEVVLKNVILADDYGISCQPYEYLFFKIPEDEYERLESISLRIHVQSEKAVLVLNEYRGNSPFTVSGDTEIVFPVSECEAGENILAYKGQIQVEAVSWKAGKNRPEKLVQWSDGKEPDYVKMAAEFLLNSRIPDTSKRSRFEGSCFAIYDYTNGCHRMPCWLWSDAPAVSAALKMVRSGAYPEMKGQLENLALSIGETFLRNQVTDPEEETFGALVSRFRYYGKTDHSFHCLLGMNDTSYSVKWALLPLYEYTGDERYRLAARRALEWVEKNIYALEFVPSHYYFENKTWEEKAFVDTGFCPDGFTEYQRITGNREFDHAAEYVMDRFIKQFSLGNGYYGQNYIPGRGVDNRLFTRGHAWVLEGLLACMRSTGKKTYYRAAKDLIYNLVKIQRKDGSFSYLMGYGEPSRAELDGSGTCEKATAILAYLFLEYDRLVPDGTVKGAARKALAWCEDNMMLEPGMGYGGIHAASLSSGITGLPYLDVATGYSNAYFILAKMLINDSNK